MDNSKISFKRMADALAIQNPRGWGTYAKILGTYVRDEKVLKVEDAIRKMTSLPARFLRLHRRGTINEGFFADIAIFDPKTVRNMSTYAEPYLHPKGIHYMLVNGKIAVDEEGPTGVIAGKVLRHSR
jgi:N-acyl-D-amino-acid deacylase